jgi:hypothetical protein
MRLSALICALALFPVAAHAARSHSRQTFLLSVTGTSTAVWDHTEQRIGLCSTTVRSQGVRTVRFTSARSTPLRFVHARWLRFDLRNLVGAADISGRQSITPDCESGEVKCAKKTIRFANGRSTIAVSGAGRVTIGAPTATLRRPDCPLQPDDIVATPLGVPVGPVQVSAQSLANRHIVKITLRASTTRRKTYGNAETGESVQRSRWTLTFVRTGR